MRTIDVVLCGLFAALIAVGAFIRITLPTTPYPFTFSPVLRIISCDHFLNET